MSEAKNIISRSDTSFDKRSIYGNVNIVWTCNMMNDDPVRPWLTDAIGDLGGEAAGIYICVLNKDRNGGNNHPTVDGHELASLLLRKLIRQNGLLPGLT